MICCIIVGWIKFIVILSIINSGLIIVKNMYGFKYCNNLWNDFIYSFFFLWNYYWIIYIFFYLSDIFCNFFIIFIILCKLIFNIIKW